MNLDKIFGIRGTLVGRTGRELEVVYKSWSEKTRTERANRAELAMILGWPVDCVATTSEMRAELIARGAGAVAGSSDAVPPVLVSVYA